MVYNDIVMNNKRQSYLLLCCAIQSICINTFAGAIKIIKDSLFYSVCLEFVSQDKSQTASTHITGMTTVRLHK
jgi:hypothetical protein